MRVGRNFKNFPKDSVITMGSFDGCHLGHRKIVSQLVSEAKKKNRQSLILTFDPPPQFFLKKSKILTLVEEKKQIFEKLRLDNLLVIKFDSKIASETAEEFIREILVDKLSISDILVGYDHRFGKERKGDFSLLEKLGKKYNFGVSAVSPQNHNGSPISSTRIRDAILKGKIEEANSLLGRPYSFRGRVFKDRERGRKLLYPTCNLKVNEKKLIPCMGVYVVYVIWKGKRFGGIMNIGTRPTFSKLGKVSVEVHIFDFKERLYGETIDVECVEKIREERTFKDEQSLRRQIEKDEKVARASIEVVS